MRIFAIAGAPLLVAGFFFKNATASWIGLAFLVVDLVFVPRETYEDLWGDFSRGPSFQRKALWGLIILCLLAPLAAGFWPSAARQWILARGTQTQAVIEKAICPWWFPHGEFEMTYRPAGRKPVRARTYWIPAEDYQRLPVGAEVAIHYLPQRPGWFALDEVPPDNASYYIPLSVSLIFFCLWFAFRLLLRL